MKKTTTKSTVPGGVLMYHLIKNLGTIACFTYLSVHFNNVWIVLLALLFTGSLNNGAQTEVVIEEEIEEAQENPNEPDWATVLKEATRKNEK